MMRRLHAPIYDARITELARLIVPHLKSGDQILDVGCGFGALGHAISKERSRPDGIGVRGLERTRRGEELIPVDGYDGETVPYDDGAFDVVILADVLHHEEKPARLLSEPAFSI